MNMLTNFNLSVRGKLKIAEIRLKATVPELMARWVSERVSKQDMMNRLDVSAKTINKLLNVYELRERGENNGPNIL